MKFLGAIGLVLVLMCGGLSGQHISEQEFTAAPVTGLQDNENVLGKDSNAQRRVIEMVQQLKHDHDYQIYVVLKRALISTNASHLSSRLQKDWLPDGNGMVIVFESDTNRLGFGRDMDAKDDMTEKSPSVPTYQVLELITQALKDSREDQKEGADVYFEKLLTRIVTKLNEYFVAKSDPVGNGRSLRLALATVGALSLLALCGMGLGWIMAKADGKTVKNRIFPKVEQPERLGAPYGAAVTSHYYGPERKN
ncbi:MAG: hypothetical protein ACSHX7_10970 [Luteolibacter sp.]